MKLPQEDHEEGMCGKLNVSLYGTRDAAQNWEEEYSSALRRAGYKSGEASPCVFYHTQKNVRIVVHGDDFTVLGAVKDLDW